LLRFDIPSIDAGCQGDIEIPIILASVFPHGTTRIDVVATAGQGDTTPLQRQCGVWVYAPPQLEVSVQSPTQEYRAGNEFSLEICVSNLGNAIVEEVELAVSLPRHSRPSVRNVGGLRDKEKRTVTWTLGQISPADKIVKQLPVDLAESFPAGTTRLAFRAVANSTKTRLTADHFCEIQVLATPQPNTRLALSCEEALPGAIVEATVSWRNDGDAVTSDAVLTLNLGRLAGFDSATAGGRFDPALSSIRWDVGDIEPGVEGCATARLSLAPVFPEGDIAFCPTLLLTSAETPPVNGVIDPLIVKAAPKIVVERTQHVDVSQTGLPVPQASADYQLSALKEGTSPGNEPPAGSVVTYKLQVTNQGNADAQDVEIFEDLPAGASFLSASDAGRYDVRIHRVSWKLGCVPANGAEVIRTAVIRFGT
jgi:uncharacterized repeat protein (TIGR01451 family)